VHHIIPRGAGGPDELANLVTLCSDCHDEAHRILSRIGESHPELLEKLRAIVVEEVCDE
jgi:5-methylcytosine-specific restriction endonuclease McrA